MGEMKKVNPEDLAQVVGGESAIVSNDSVSYVNCRVAPSMNADILFTIPNGTELSLTGNRIYRDGYTWCEVRLAGGYEYGWVCEHLLAFG